MIAPITVQPRKNDSEKNRTNSEKSDETEQKQLRGLSSLSITNSVVIEVEKKCCDFDSTYMIKNYDAGESVMFTAVEESHCCSFGNVQIVIIRDLQKSAVGRICYKEKSCFAGDMAMQIYSPPDVLIGSVKEISSCFTSSSIFKIWNSDDQKLFCIKYNQGLGPQICGCSSNFTVTSEDTNQEVAKILEKSRQRLKIQFKTKLNVTNKMVLTGFCLGLIHKVYKQKDGEAD